jgi:hypothetical protein
VVACYELTAARAKTRGCANVKGTRPHCRIDGDLECHIELGRVCG